MDKKPVNNAAMRNSAVSSASKAVEKTAVKPAEVKPAAVKPTEVKPAEKAVEAKAQEKPAEVKKEIKAAPKKAEKKPAAKKAEKKEFVPEVYIQYQDSEDIVKDVLDRIKTAYVEDGHRVGAIKSMQVYLKPEESAAYYVINGGKYNGKVNLF